MSAEPILVRHGRIFLPFCGFLVFLCSMAYFVMKYRPSSPSLHTEIQIPKEIPIYLTVYTYPLYAHRVEVLFSTWLPKFFKRFPSSHFNFLSSGPLPQHNEFVRVVQEPPMEYVYTKLIYRLVDGLSFFVNNLTDRWYFLTTDDVYVSISRLSSLIQSLDRVYNSSTDVVFRGQVYPFDIDQFFVHGGSGYVFSRAAAKKILEKKADLLSFVGEGVPDDMIISHALPILGLSRSEVHDRRFFGTNIDKEAKEIVDAEKYSELPLCSNVRKADGMNYFFEPFPMSEVVVWHGALFDAFVLRDGGKVLSRLPKNVSYYISDPFAHFCVED